MKSFLSHALAKAGISAIVLSLCSCNAMSRAMNPFYEAPAPVALLGEKNDSALGGGSGAKEETARKALQEMASYERAHDPQPVNPVIRPAVVRLMWIPDHLNKNGDLVPAHFYYLKVKKDDWAVKDAFELEGQLGSTRSGSNLPFIIDGK
jgi:hypothetical protein